jgi:hypothetical protein
VAFGILKLWNVFIRSLSRRIGVEEFGLGPKSLGWWIKLFRPVGGDALELGKLLEHGRWGLGFRGGGVVSVVGGLWVIHKKSVVIVHGGFSARVLSCVLSYWSSLRSVSEHRFFSAECASHVIRLRQHHVRAPARPRPHAGRWWGADAACWSSEFIVGSCWAFLVSVGVLYGLFCLDGAVHMPMWLCCLRCRSCLLVTVAFSIELGQGGRSAAR